MGGPNLVQFTRSYNEKFGTALTKPANPDVAWTLENCVSPYVITNEGREQRWLLCEAIPYHPFIPVWYIRSDGYLGISTVGGIRPMVQLPSSAKAKWNGTAWDLGN